MLPGETTERPAASEMMQVRCAQPTCISFLCSAVVVSTFLACSQLGFKMSSRNEKFNFMGCVSMWDDIPHLRRRALNMKVLAQDAKGNKRVSINVANLKVNLDVLRPFTITMAKFGRIRKPIDLMKEALQAFYRKQLADENLNDPAIEAKIDTCAGGSAFYLKKMLTLVKHNFKRWEMPRVPWYGSIHTHICNMHVYYVRDSKDKSTRSLVLDLAAARKLAMKEPGLIQHVLVMFDVT